MTIAPLLIGLVLTFFAFVVAGLSESSGEDVLAVTIEAGLALTGLAILVTMTFGVAGVVVLWAFNQPGPFAWIVAGALAGGLSALLFGRILMGGTGGVLLAIFLISGIALFLTIRRIAGIQDESSAE